MESILKELPGHNCPEDHLSENLDVPLVWQGWTNFTDTSEWGTFTRPYKWTLRFWVNISPLYPDGQTLEFSEDRMPLRRSHEKASVAHSTID